MQKFMEGTWSHALRKEQRLKLFENKVLDLRETLSNNRIFSIKQIFFTLD
jgi:hypothetical protein